MLLWDNQVLSKSEMVFNFNWKILKKNVNGKAQSNKYNKVYGIKP